MSKNFARLVFSFMLVFFCAFFLWPILQILKGGFIDADGKLTFAYLGSLLTDPIYLGGLANSFLLALTTTTFALLIALPLAFVSDRFLFPGKGFLGSLVLVPMILPPFVGAIGIKQILGQYGALNALIINLGLRPEGWTFDWLGANQFLGIALVNAFSLYPIIYLNVVAALANIDPALEEAAENLGCTGLRKFIRITLPLIKSGLFAGGTIVFIWAFTDLGVALIFDYSRVTSVQIFYGLKDIGGNPFPYALVAVMLFSSVCFYALGKGLFGRDAYAMMAKATSSGGPVELTRGRAWLCTALFATVTFIAILPHLGVVLVAFSSDWYATVLPRHFNLHNFEMAFGHDLTVPAIANSLKYASISTVIDLFLGVALAYVIVRSKVAGRQILDFLAMMPLAVPGLVLAFGLAERGSSCKVLGAVMLQGFDQRACPGRGCSHNLRRSLAFEHFFPEEFAFDRLTIRLRHWQRFGIQLTADLKLGQRPLPVAGNAQQLKQMGTELGVACISTNLIL